ncbi:MAG: PAS domain-containing protein, partial [Clostridia bacterium]|nr:PAS domain-containing protein [Clostridia bacterium]
MEQSLLLKIGDSVKEYANVISNVLDVDVEIADHQLVRVAGTGRFARFINERMKSEGNAFKKVLATKKNVFVDDARYHEVCIDCPCKDICMEQCDLCCPIILKDEVIGAISLGSTSKEKKKQIVDNLTQYSEFIENIADLIATKALEYISFQQQAHSLELLQNLVNLINDGVIIFDNDHNILFINKKTELILGNNLVQLKYLDKIKQFSIQKIKNKLTIPDVEYYVRVQKRKIRLIGTIYPINIQSEKLSQVFIFQDIESLQQNLLSNHLESFNFNYLKGNDENFI